LTLACTLVLEDYSTVVEDMHIRNEKRWHSLQSTRSVGDCASAGFFLIARPRDLSLKHLRQDELQIFTNATIHQRNNQDGPSTHSIVSLHTMVANYFFFRVDDRKMMMKTQQVDQKDWRRSFCIRTRMNDWREPSKSNEERAVRALRLLILDCLQI
jgi:hypothetical protein